MLVNGSNRCSGKVNIYHAGTWKRACNNEWTRSVENVVCAEINCGLAATEREDADFGEQSVPGGIKTICTGNETSVGQCTIEEVAENCMEASVVCTSKLQFRPFIGFTHKYCAKVTTIFQNEMYKQAL